MVHKNVYIRLLAACTFFGHAVYGMDWGQEFEEQEANYLLDDASLPTPSLYGFEVNDDRDAQYGDMAGYFPSFEQQFRQQEGQPRLDYPSSSHEEVLPALSGDIDGSINLGLPHAGSELAGGRHVVGSANQNKRKRAVSGGEGHNKALRLEQNVLDDHAVQAPPQAGLEAEVDLGSCLGLSYFPAEAPIVDFDAQAVQGALAPVDAAIQVMPSSAGDQCLVCHRTVNGDSSHMKEHMRTHAAEKPFECDTCTKRFTKKSDLKNHMRTHTGEKPFECDTCTKRFTKKSNLNFHMRIHAGENPFECKVCGKTFGRKSSAQRHMKTHTDSELGEGDGLLENHAAQAPDQDGAEAQVDLDSYLEQGYFPAEAPIADLDAQQEQRLSVEKAKELIQKATKVGDVWTCPVDDCGTQIKGGRGRLRVHMRIHTGEKPFACEACGKTFTQKGHMQRHILKMHPVQDS